MNTEQFNGERCGNLYIDRDNAAITHQQEVEFFFWELILLDPLDDTCSLEGKTCTLRKLFSEEQTR
jgi:hypothetical protein